MRNRDSGISYAIYPVVIIMLYVLKYILMPELELHKQNGDVFVFGLVTIGIMVLPVICLGNEIKKHVGISLEVINLIIIIAVLIGCAHWALIVQGGLGNIAGLIVTFGGLI
jgi:hypothetical protein